MQLCRFFLVSKGGNFFLQRSRLRAPFPGLSPDSSPVPPPPSRHFSHIFSPLCKGPGPPGHLVCLLAGVAGGGGGRHGGGDGRAGRATVDSAVPDDGGPTREEVSSGQLELTSLPFGYYEALDKEFIPSCIRVLLT